MFISLLSCFYLLELILAWASCFVLPTVPHTSRAQLAGRSARRRLKYHSPPLECASSRICLTVVPFVPFDFTIYLSYKSISTTSVCSFVATAKVYIRGYYQLVAQVDLGINSTTRTSNLQSRKLLKAKVLLYLGHYSTWVIISAAHQGHSSFN